jgi:hypothetical protein
MAAERCSKVREVFCFPIVPGSAPMPPYRCGWDAELADPRSQGQFLRTELVKRAQQQSHQLTSHGALVAFIRRSPLVGVYDLDL